MNSVVCVRVEFDSAHRLYPYEGKCANIHGHRYQVDIGIPGSIDYRGMVADFGDLKCLFKGFVDRVFDHALILSDEDPLGPKLADLGIEVRILEGSPTAENMAQYLYDQFTELVAPEGLAIGYVRVYETPNCFAVAT